MNLQCHSRAIFPENAFGERLLEGNLPQGFFFTQKLIYISRSAFTLYSYYIFGHYFVCFLCGNLFSTFRPEA